jgi:hypothetical protein
VANSFKYLLVFLKGASAVAILLLTFKKASCPVTPKPSNYVLYSDKDLPEVFKEAEKADKFNFPVLTSVAAYK